MKKIVLMRGLPGSGKSFQAQKIRKERGGVILSTDIFHLDKKGVYKYNAFEAKKYHEKVQDLCIDFCFQGIETIIIDNTNLTAQEIKPYQLIAKALGYEIELAYSSAPWANDPVECFKRNTKGVRLMRILEMNEKFERNLDLV